MELTTTETTGTAAVLGRVEDMTTEVLFCFDRTTGLRAIIAVHDTTLGPAWGTCIFPTLRRRRTERCAAPEPRHDHKARSPGWTWAGGKAVISSATAAPDKTEAMFRRFGRFVDSLNGRYITAGGRRDEHRRDGEHPQGDEACGRSARGDGRQWR